MTARCPLCGAETGGIEECRDKYFGDVLAREYMSPTAYGKVHLLTVDSYVLQHSEDHGPRSNALHLVRLGWLLSGGDPGIGNTKGPIPHIMEHYYRDFPFISPPVAMHRGDVTIIDMYNARSAEEHAQISHRWGKSVWDAYREHHAWAIDILKKAGVEFKDPGRA